MAVLVTGGAGFVGSHLVDRLMRGGEHVVVLDNLSTGHLANLNGALSSGAVTFVFGDLAAPAAELRELVERAAGEPFSRIFHLASPAGPRADGAQPWETLAVNGPGTMALVELALAHGARLLYASASDAYGDPLVHPQIESYFGNVDPVGPRACYDEGKRFGEAVLSVATRTRGLDGRIVRTFNCYGPRMDVSDGRLVPALLAAARAGRPLPVHGSGAQTRSLTYVDDAVSGMLAVMAAEPALAAGPVNVGSEDEQSVLDIARAVAAVTGVRFETTALPARPGDPQRRRPDITRARALGWAPSTELADGLRRTYAWLVTDALQYA